MCLSFGEIASHLKDELRIEGWNEPGPIETRSDLSPCIRHNLRDGMVGLL
jgi:hypothetical protein